MKNTMLYNYVRWNDNKNVIKLLNQYSDIDLMNEEGICFQISIKHNNHEMLTTLLEYFEKIQLKDKELDSMEYKLTKYKLRECLENAVNSFDIFEETQKVLTPYLPQEEEDYQLNDFLVTEIFIPTYESSDKIHVGDNNDYTD